MDPSLENLVEILSRTFSKFNQSECDDILISIGSTGSGKSTLLGSMVAGADKMK